MPKQLAHMYFEPAQIQEMGIISKNTDRTVASLVREAVDQWLERRKKGRRTTLRPYSPDAFKK